MVNRDSVNNFINFSFIPFSKSQCIKRYIVIWILSISASVVGVHKFLWFTILAIVNIAVGFIFSVLCFKPDNKNSRFISDGLTCFYTSVLLSILSYKFFVFESEENVLLLIALLGLLLINILFFVFIVYLNIKHNNYDSAKTPSNMLISPFICGLIGLGVAHIILMDVSSDNANVILAACLLFISLLMSIGSTNFLKVILLKKISC